MELRLASTAAPAKPRVSLHAAITPDGGRTYRWGGCAASGREVRARLARLGIRLGDASHAVIRQEAVTALADAADPSALAAVVAQASGLEAWVAQAAAATAELDAQHRDAARIGEALAALETTCEVARAEVARSELQAALEGAAEEAAREAATLAATGVSAAQQLRESMETHVSRAEEELRRAEEEQRAISEGTGGPAPAAAAPPADASPRRHDLGLRRAAIEESVVLAQEQLEALASRAAAAQTARSRAAAAARRQDLALRDATALQQVGARQDALRSAASTEARLAEARRAVAAAATALSQAQARQRAAQARAASLSTPTTITADPAPLASLAAELRCRQRALGPAPPVGPACVSPSLTPLASCFTFNDPAALLSSQLSAAMEAVAGGHLAAVVVAPTTAAAAQAVDSGAAHGMRIWALDALHPGTGRLAAQREAAAAFPPGSVTVPLDLLTAAPGCKAAVSRAFGTHVIVATPELGRAVLERHGLPSVALDGTVTSRGALAGGWAPGRRGAAGAVHRKLQRDAVAAESAALRQRLAEVEAALAAAQARAAALKERELAAEEMDAAVSGLAAAVAAAQQAATAEEAAAEEAAAARALAHALGGSGAGDPSPGAIQAHVAQRKAEAEAAERERVAAVAEAAAAEATLDEGAVTEGRAALEALRGQLGELNAEIQALDEASAQQRDQAQAAAREAEAARQRALAAAQQARRAAAGRVTEARHQLKQADAVLVELKSLQQALPPAPPPSPLPPPPPLPSLQNDILPAVRAASDCTTALKRELAKLSASPAAAAALAHSRAAEIAAQEVTLARARAEQMAAGAARLAEGVAATDPLAQRLNEATLEAGGAVFRRLAAVLLGPAVEVDIQRLGPVLHADGARFRHRRGPAAPDAPWTLGLAALSGGQRALVSLAFTVAARVAAGGGGDAPSSSSVLLADEVDAALDTANQEAAAQLLRLLLPSAHAGGGPPALAQVICISHSPEFQRVCDRVVALRRGANGATALAGVTERTGEE